MIRYYKHAPKKEHIKVHTKHTKSAKENNKKAKEQLSWDY